MLVDKKLEIY